MERLRGAELRAPRAHVCVFRRRGSKLDKTGVAVDRSAAACGGAVEGGVGAGETGWGGGMGDLLGEERWRNGFAAGLLGCYLVLFLRDLGVKAKGKR